MKRFPVVGAALLLAGAIAAPAVAGDRFAANLGPSPLVVEEVDSPALYVANVGDVDVIVRLELTGDGYALGALPSSDALTPGQQVAFPLAAIGDGQALARATVTPAAASTGQDSVAIVLEGVVRHQTPLEHYRSMIAPALVVVALVVLLVGGLATVVVRRRRSTP